MENKNVYRIPFPGEILKGEWSGTVYAICSEFTSKEEHEKEVDRKVAELKENFSKNNHWSVSLREVKRELVVEFERTDSYMTLVQFRVRDSF